MDNNDLDKCEHVVTTTVGVDNVDTVIHQLVKCINEQRKVINDMHNTLKEQGIDIENLKRSIYDLKKENSEYRFRSSGKWKV